ncbi:MAG: DNA recombination protein RmuC, partial [Coxiellaceae bacterium]|nr:DNA recombination protein RmuC [Coxiellaceae bacterium]
MTWQLILTTLSPILIILFLAYASFQNKLERNTIESLLKEQQKENQEQRTRFDEHQIKSLKLIQDSLQQALNEIRKQVTTSLNQHTEELGKRMDKLTNQTQDKLKEISTEVDKRLTNGFEKTTATFTDIVKRLTVIDQAQKKITELSSNVVSLQDILNDKRSRGAFGEVQLSSLIRNVIPESNFSMQHTLS